MKQAKLTTPYGHMYNLTRNENGVVTDENGIIFETRKSEWISDYGALYASNQKSQIMFWHELHPTVQALFK